MAARSGRDLIIKKATVAIAGVRTTSVSIDNSPVDITSKSDGGFRKLASFAGMRALDISVEGVWEDQIISDIAIGTGSALLTDITIEDGVDRITGDFYIANFEYAGDHDGEMTYSATLQSSEAWAMAALP